MKKVLPLIVLLSICVSSFSQNILFREFGSNHAEITAFLNDKGYVDVRYDQAEKIVATTGKYVISYHFQNDKLIKMVLLKNYDNKKDSHIAIQSFQNYYTLVGASVMELEKSKNTQHFVAYKQKERHDVYHRDLKNGKHQIKMVSQRYDSFAQPPTPKGAKEVYATLQD